MIRANDSTPTRVPEPGTTANNLDLIFAYSEILLSSPIEDLSEAHGSDHLPVLMILNTKVKSSRRPSHSSITSGVIWVAFSRSVEKGIPALEDQLRTIF